MSMVKTIAAQTVRLSVRSGALPIACAVVTLLLWVASFSAYRHQQAQSQQRDFYARTVRSQWLDQPDRHPHRASHYGYMAFRVGSPLGFFDRGVDTFAGTAIFLEAHRQNPANFSEAGQSAATVRLGELTPALVLQAVAPLILFFLGFAAVSGDRESGTLAMMLAQGAAPSTVMWGKALGLLAGTLMMVAPGLTAVLTLSVVSGGAAAAGRAALLLAAYGLYLAICTLIAILVSAWQTSSRASLTALILIWVCGLVIMPRALQAWGSSSWPAPSRAQFDALLEDDLEHTGDSHNPNDSHFAALRAKVLAEYSVNRVEDLPFNYSALVMKESEAISSGIFARHYGRLIGVFQRQGAPLETASLFNPFLAVRRISMALAGSDLRHFIEFQKQAESFRFELVQKLNDLHLTEIQQRNDRGQRVSRERWKDFPPFVYRAPSLGAVLREHWLALLSLAAWFAALSAAVCFRKVAR